MDTILYFQSPTKTSAPDKIAGVRRHAAVADWHVQAVDGIPASNALEGLVSFWHPLGIILDCGGGYQEIPTDLFAGLPTVYLDRNPRTMPADTSCVSHDSVATGQLAAKELLVAGHPNFAFVPYPQPRFWSDDRERGFRDALALNGLTCETFDGGGRGTLQSVAWQKSLRRWIEQLPKPCGIFAANDAVAAEVLIAAAQTGFDVPREIAVCGVDNFAPICEHTVPTLTSVQPDFLMAGELAARTLGEIAQGEHRQETRLTFGPASIVRRASTRICRRYDPEATAAMELIRRRACEGISSSEVVACLQVLAAHGGDTLPPDCRSLHARRDTGRAARQGKGTAQKHGTGHFRHRQLLRLQGGKRLVEVLPPGNRRLPYGMAKAKRLSRIRRNALPPRASPAAPASGGTMSKV